MLQVLSYFEQNSLFAGNQFGLRKNVSTSHAILTLIDKITQSFEDKRYYVALFLDLSKAFDTVSHQILLRKLEYYNFRTRSL
jgi:hypothetical protein